MKYNLTSGVFSDEEKESIKEMFASTSEKVDMAESVVRSLGLSDFELLVLARRLSDD